MGKNILFIGLLVSLVILMLGCVQNPLCGNAICESGEDNPSALNYCIQDCVVKEPTPVESLANAVKSANPSGEMQTGNFVLAKGISVDQSDLALATDLDASSFIFEQGAIDEAELSVGTGDYLSYVGAQQEKIISAIVICKPTQEQMNESIERLLDNYPEFIFGNYENCPTDLVCCVIIPDQRN